MESSDGGSTKTHRCIAVDLKGYGQSDKTAGDYWHAGAGEQLYTRLQQIGVTKFNLVTHDRGTVQADYIVANHPESVLRYGRGEQHLYHSIRISRHKERPLWKRRGQVLWKIKKRFVVWVYTWITKLPIPDGEVRRLIQEFSYPRINRAVTRYFNS